MEWGRWRERETYGQMAVSRTGDGAHRARAWSLPKADKDTKVTLTEELLSKEGRFWGENMDHSCDA